MNVSIRLIRPNLTCVTVGALTIWFSYETPVAFRQGAHFVISQNIWSKTTGRHLNEIDPDKSIRVPHDEFCRELRRYTTE